MALKEQRINQERVFLFVFLSLVSREGAQLLNLRYRALILRFYFFSVLRDERRAQDNARSIQGQHYNQYNARQGQ